MDTILTAGTKSTFGLSVMKKGEAGVGLSEMKGGQTSVGEVIDNLYKEASETLKYQYRENISSKLLNLVITHLDTLNPEVQSFPEISPALQEVMVVLIEWEKANLGPTSLIKMSDIETMLNKLSEKKDVPIFNVTKVKDIELLLETGIERHNSRTGLHISLGTKAFYFQKLKENNEEVNRLYANGTSAEDIFTNHPECRLDKHVLDEHVAYDATGFAYLKSLGIGGPLTTQKLTNGKWTIEEAQAAARDVLKKLLEMLNSPILSIDERGSFRIITCIDDGSLTNERLKNSPVLSWNTRQNLGSLGVRKYVVDDSLPLEKAVDLSQLQRNALESEGVQKYIDNGLLKIEHALKLSERQLSLLNTPGVQKYIDNGFLKMERALTLTITQMLDLDDDRVQEKIDDQGWPIEYVLNIGSEDRGCLMCG